MRIPIDVLNSRKIQPQMDDQSKEFQLLLSLSNEDFLLKTQENPQIFKQQINSHTLFEIYNKLDYYLELIIEKFYQENTIRYQTELNNILQIITNLISVKVNRTLFRSLDRMLVILRISEDFNSIHQILNIIIQFFSNRESAFKEIEFFDDQISEMLNLIKIFMLHKNMNSKQEIKFSDFFRDDLGYERYLNNNKQYEKNDLNIIYDNSLEIEFIYPSYQATSYKEIKSMQFEEPQVLLIKYQNINEFQNQNSINIAKNIISQINQENSISIKEESPLFDVLNYRIKISKNFHCIKQRMQIVKTAIIALQAYVIIRKIYEIQKVHLLEQIFPLVPDYLLSFKDILQLLFFDLEPKFHIELLKISSMILQIDENFDFSVLMSEITNHFNFIQKIYKDCTFLQIKDDQLVAINPQVLNPQIAIQNDFLHELLLFLKKTCKNIVKEELIHTLTNSIYKISVVMNSILKIVDTPYQDDQKSIFSIENSILVIDILSLLMPKSQEILRDFNIIDKVMGRLEYDLNLILKNTKIKAFKNQILEQVNPKDQIRFIAAMLKLLSQPFVRKTQNNHTLTAPTLARKIADSPIMVQCAQILKNYQIDYDILLLNFMILTGDIMQEVPQLIDSFIENGVLISILQQLKQTIPKDLDTIPNVIYFVNMYCLVERGRTIENQYNIIGKVLDVIVDKEYIEVLSSTKSLLKGKCYDTIALEICEMINFVEHLKDPVFNSILNVCVKMDKIVQDYNNSLFNFIETGQYQPQDLFQLDQNELLLKMIVNFTKFFSKLFNQRSVIVKNLIESHALISYINVVCSPVVILSDQIKNIWLTTRPIIQESKYVETDLSNILNKLFSSHQFQLDFLFKNQQFNKIVHLDTLIDIKKNGIKNLLIQKDIQKKEVLNMHILLVKCEFLLDFICMARFSKDLKENIQILETFTEIYGPLVQHQFLEEQLLQEKQIELDLKKQNFLVSIRKYFITSIKNIPHLERKNEQFVIRKFAQLVSKILLTLELNDSKFNQKLLENACDLLVGYNEIFKRTGRINPWILIIQYQSKSLNKFIEYCSYFFLNFDEKNQQQLFNISLFIKNIFFIQQDTNVQIEINNKNEKGNTLEPYMNTIYIDQLNLLQNLIQTILEQNSFNQASCKQFLEVLFEKLKKLNLIIQDQKESPQKQNKSKIESIQQGMNPEMVQITEQLVDMGFTISQAELALSQIDYPDINLATEWLLTQPEEILKQNLIQEQQVNQKTQVQIEPLKKDDFKQQALNSLNLIARMLVYQIFELQSHCGSIGEFIQSIIQFQPNIDAKKTFFNELSYIIMSGIKQLVNTKKNRFRVTIKGRQEIDCLIRDKKLIKDLNDNDPQQIKIQKFNILLGLFLRICFQSDQQIKHQVLNGKFFLEFLKFSEVVLYTIEQMDDVFKQFLLLILKLFNEILISNFDFDISTHQSIIQFIIIFLGKFQNNQILIKNSQEGVIQILIILLQKNIQNVQLFNKNKGLNFLMQSKSTDGYAGFLQNFCQLVTILLEDEDIIYSTIENEIIYLFSHNKQQLEFEPFLKYFQKYQKSKQFIEIVQKICVITNEKQVKMIQLIQPHPIPNKGQIKLQAQSLDVISILIENCLQDLQLFFDNKPRSIFNFNLIIKTLHVIIRQYPIFTKAILSYNCQKFVKRNPNLLLKPTNNTFMQVLLRTIVYMTEDKLRNIIFEICLDNSYNINNNSRIKVLQEIYDILQTEINSQNFMKNQISIHSFTTYTSLHLFLLSIREITKLSLREEMNFIKLYSDAFIKLNLKTYYNLENFIPFILEPLSVLNQYALALAFNKVDKNNENWILNQLMPSKLLIKHQNMVDDWIGIIKNPPNDNNFYQNLVMQAGQDDLEHVDYQNSDGDDNGQEEEGDQYDDISEEQGNEDEDREDEEDNNEDENDDDDDDDDDDDEDDEDDEDDIMRQDIDIESNSYSELIQDSINRDELEIEDNNYISEESDDNQDNENGGFSSESYADYDQNANEDESNDDINEEYIEIEEINSQFRQRQDKNIKFDQDIGQIVNLSFLTQIDQELTKINQNFVQFFKNQYGNYQEQDQFLIQISKLYQEVEENSNQILQKPIENQWNQFDLPQQNQIQTRSLFNDWQMEEDTLEINGQQYIVATDRQEYIPFQITQALQNAFRGTNFRMISSNTDLARESRDHTRYFYNQQLQRQRDNEDQQNFRNAILERIQQQESQQQQIQQPDQPAQQIQQEQQQQIQNQEQELQSQIQQQQELLNQQQQIQQQVQNVQPNLENAQNIVRTSQFEIQQQGQQMEIESQGLNFEDLGLPNDFLQQNNIDPLIFNGLSEELKMEIILEYLPKEEQVIQSQSQDNENLVFLNSLPPNLREEVLITSDQLFIQSLPQEIQQEAQQLRENQIVRNNRFSYIDLNQHQQQQIQQKSPKRKKSKVQIENQKQLLKTKEVAKLMIVEDLFIEKIISLLYMDDLSFGRFPFELLKTLVYHPKNEFRILFALLFLLQSKQQQINDFPLNAIIGRDIIKRNYTEVYQQISIKILYIFNKCCSQNALTFFLDQIENKKSIQKVEQLKEQSNGNSPFMILIDLLKENLMVQNDENLDYLVSLLNNIVKKAVNNQESLNYKFQMDKNRVKSLCNILSKSDEHIMKKLSYVISVFCYERENLDLFIDELKLTILYLSQLMNKLIEKNLLELQNRNNQMEIEYQYQSKDALLIAKIENEFEEDIKMQKIFKLIKQLLESYNSESNQILEIRQNFQSLINGDELNSLWINISEFLINLYKTFSKSINIVNPLVNKLTPILECFFIIYKIAIEEQNKEKKDIKQIMIQEIGDEISPLSIERSFSQMRKEKLGPEDFFLLISEKNKKFINLMVKQNVNILNDSLSLIVKKAPHLLDFENKKLYFKTKLKQNKQRQYSQQIRIKVRRNEIFKDSYSQLSSRKGSELSGKLFIEFSGEEGMDAGGLTREWYLLLSKEIFNPNYALFMPSANGVTFQPSPHSKINPDHLRFFKFVGRFIAKALNDGYMLDAYFTRAFYKHILGQPLNISDMEDIDPQYYKNLKWILENDITNFDLTFSYESDEFGYHLIKDLIPNGQNILVTEDNKIEYVKQICYVKMGKDIEAQLKAFLEGFHELIPNNIISIFNSKELELMISGLPDIDIQDLKINTEYNGYNQNSQIIRNFWEILENFDKQEKAGFIQFVTGTSKVPLEGFSQLRGMGGVAQKFMIHKAYDTNKLPTSHTCFNQLDLPEYKTKEILKEKLLLSINEGKEGFGFV